MGYDKICTTCGQKFVGNREWSIYCSSKCRDTSPKKIISTGAFRQKRRDMLNEIKLKRGCEFCGYNEHPAALHFDHIDPTTKSFTISQDPKKAWRLIEEEITKCRVLCANCHSIETFEKNHYWGARK